MLRRISSSVLSGVLQLPSSNAVGSVTVPSLFQPDIARSVKVFQVEVSLCMYVACLACMHVYAHYVCMYVCMYAQYIYVCMYVCVYVQYVCDV